MNAGLISDAIGTVNGPLELACPRSYIHQVLPHLLTEIPGPTSRQLANTLRRFESRNITASAEAIFWKRASGTNVWDADGNRFLDLTSAFGVAGLGHTHEAIQEALRQQSGELLHAMGDVHPAALKPALCQKLSEMTFERWGVGPGKTILGNSGFEAVEAALKTSMLHSGKSGVIAFQGAYHGLGYGALEVAGIPTFREPFRRQLGEFATLLPFPHCAHCPYDVHEAFRLEGGVFPNCSSLCLAKLEEEIYRAIEQREIGCILVEPIQGRGGVVVPPLDFLRMLRRICDSEKILLILDEIFTGLNRTGQLFACDHSKVVPDMICVGKALTGGFPLSACIGRATVMDAWPESTGEALHTSTFLGNPLGCAMALAALEEHSRPEVSLHVQERGRKLRAALNTLRSPDLRHVRGVGLLQGVEFETSRETLEMMRRGLRDGMILLPDSPRADVLALTPPFGITDEEIDWSVGKLQEYLTSLPGSIS